MPISHELQAKIDALEDEKLRAEILQLLAIPSEKRVSDEEIYENSLASYTMVKEQQARTRKWRDDEVVAFAQYFSVLSPRDYAEFLRQDKEFNWIDDELGWETRRLISRWAPNLDYFLDGGELFGDFRDYVKATFHESALERQPVGDNATPLSPELRAKIDALESEKLRLRILWALAAPVERRASDEATYQIILSADAMAKELLSQVTLWSKDEVATFARYFSEIEPEGYADFLRQKDLIRFEPELDFSVRFYIGQWSRDFTVAGNNARFDQFRDYLKTTPKLIGPDDPAAWARATPISLGMQIEIFTLEDEALKARIHRVLSCPWRGVVSDEAIYKTMVSNHQEAELDRESLEEWNSDLGEKFAHYFKEERPQEYAEFLRLAKASDPVISELVWDIYRWVRQTWIGMKSPDRKLTYEKFYNYVKRNLI
ncbi:hypothetical protein [Lysobacter sp. CA199]|uniref:hypothetical protein n=1 Tax=Lysobacter sp. CA199 TaxID=3455608 RepID=UPI003F8D046A